MLETVATSWEIYIHTNVINSPRAIFSLSLSLSKSFCFHLTPPHTLMSSTCANPVNTSASLKLWKHVDLLSMHPPHLKLHRVSFHAIWGPRPLLCTVLYVGYASLDSLDILTANRLLKGWGATSPLHSQGEKEQENIGNTLRWANRFSFQQIPRPHWVHLQFRVSPSCLCSLQELIFIPAVHCCPFRARQTPTPAGRRTQTCPWRRTQRLWGRRLTDRRSPHSRKQRSERSCCN